MPERENSNSDYRIQRIEYPRNLNRKLIEQWAAMPVFRHDDPSRPEWPPTPVRKLQIEGYGNVWIKDESDKKSNPTGTMKDRAAWEMAVLYRDMAMAYYDELIFNKLTENELNAIPIPRLTFITAGNEGIAVAARFAEHNLPPPKLIIGIATDPHIAQALYATRADIYPVDLSSHSLTEQEVLQLSENDQGSNAESPFTFEPASIFYDWHVHESFNEEPDGIFVPKGSGRLSENYIHWQGRTIDNQSAGTPDPRLKADWKKVRDMSIIAVETAYPNTKAKILYAKFKPFLFFQDRDIASRVDFRRTGRLTQTLRLTAEQESLIEEAMKVYGQAGISSSYESAAAMAGYLGMLKTGKIDPEKKFLVINSGSGLFEQPTQYF